MLGFIIKHITHEKSMKVVCLGPDGSFTSAVAKRVFPDATLEFMQTYEGAQGLKSKTFDYAVYPLENNTGGFVYDTLRAIYQTAKISIVGLEYVKIKQNLITQCKKMTDIEAIHSHPNAIAQCQKKIEEIQKRKRKKGDSEIQIVKISSTSQGVIDASKQPKIAAIASKEAAELHKVPILKEGFQDKSRNETRFVILKIGAPPKPTGNDRSMFLVEVQHEPGSLAQILNHINSLSINNLALVPHPLYRETGSWEYAFFIEVDGHATVEPLKTLCKTLSGKRLRGQTRKGRYLGSYPNRNE